MTTDELLRVVVVRRGKVRPTEFRLREGEVGRMYPAVRHERVVLLIDNAPWHRGEPIDEALRDNPHLEFKRVPSYRPQRNPIERFWKVPRRRATHNRRFDTLADLKTSIRASLCYYPDREGPGPNPARPQGEETDTVNRIANETLKPERLQSILLTRLAEPRPPNH